MPGARRVRREAAAESGEYRVLARSAPLRPGELEGMEPRVEIVVSWGEGYVLHVAHVAPTRGFVLADCPAADGCGPDFALDARLLGCERLALVLDWNGQPAFTIPADAQGWLELAGERISFSELGTQGLLRAVPGCEGARQTALPRAARAQIQLGQLSFSVRCVTGAQRVGLDGRMSPDWRDQAWTLASAALHVALLLWLYALPAPLSANSDDSRYPDGRAPAPALDVRSPPSLVSVRGLDRRLSVRAAAVSGARPGPVAGRRADASDRPPLAAARGHAGTSDRRAPEHARDRARDAGILGVLRASGDRVNTTTWTSAYGRDRALGYDGADTLGRALGDRSLPRASFGFGGLSAHGTGRGAGGSALGTIGVGLATREGPLIAHGTGSGYGSDAGGFRARDPRMPRVRTCSYRRCDSLVTGALAKDVIRRVVHQRLGEVRDCYERALITRPDLTGRVSIDFVVGPSGSVQAAAVRESNLRAPELEQCIAQSVRRWAFPQPRDGGMVQVNYPFTLTPDS